MGKPRLSARALVWNEAASRWLHAGETVCDCAGCGGLAVVILGPGASLDGTELCDGCTHHYFTVSRYARQAAFAAGPIDEAGQTITQTL